MAIRPEISLALDNVNVSPAINAFENAMLNAQTRGIRQQQAQHQAALNPLVQQQAQIQLQQAQDNKRLSDDALVVQGVRPLLSQAMETGDPTAVKVYLTKTLTDIQARNAQGANIDPTRVKGALDAINEGKLEQVLTGGDNLVQMARDRGLLGGGQQGMTSGQRDFQSQSQGLSEDDKIKARRIALGLDPRAGSSSEERIAANTDLAEAVGDTQADIAGKKATATESSKLKQQLLHKPAITRAVKLAEKEATERGDVLTDLARAEAGLPGLIEATNSLKELATAATSTYGGRLFDTILKETGWGSTKGANARAKYISVIDNQVLPLLKQTFGGAMTEGEGLRLSNTFGDPNATPEQKMLQTEAFIEQKVRNIEALKRQSENQQPDRGQGQIMEDANGNRARVFDDGTFEELP